MIPGLEIVRCGLSAKRLTHGHFLPNARLSSDHEHIVLQHCVLSAKRREALSSPTRCIYLANRTSVLFFCHPRAILKPSNRPSDPYDTSIDPPPSCVRARANTRRGPRPSIGNDPPLGRGTVFLEGNRNQPSRKPDHSARVITRGIAPAIVGCLQKGAHRALRRNRMRSDELSVAGQHTGGLGELQSTWRKRDRSSISYPRANW
jgi:hypothetical protein